MLRAMQSFCSGTLSVLMFVSVMATLPPGLRAVSGSPSSPSHQPHRPRSMPPPAPLSPNAGAGRVCIFSTSLRRLIFLVLAWRFLRPAPRAMRLSEIDWLGYVVLAVGLAALIMFMKQGDRFFWLDNPIIRHAGLSAVAERFRGLVASFLATHGDPALAARQAWAALSAMLSDRGLTYWRSRMRSP